MKCLESLVGLMNVCEETDNLCYTGIPLKMWSKLANEEDVSGKNLFERLRKQAASLLANEFTNCLGNAYQWSEVIESTIHGRWDKDSKKIPCDDNRFIGRRIQKECNDPYLSPQVVSFCVNVVQATDCFIYYTNDGCGEVKHKAALRCGRNTIDINSTADCIDIYFKPQGLEFYEASLTGCNCHNTCSCNPCFEVSNMISDVDGSFGYYECTPFQVCVNCVCLDDVLVCKYRASLKQAMIYRLESLFWEEFETSCRKNEVARGLKDEAIQKLAKLMGGNHVTTGDKIEKRDSKYWAELWSVGKRIKVSIKPSRCVSCNTRMYMESI